ncbi:N-acetylmuramidase domain-containing protein [Pedobacter steynii]
MQFEPTWFKRKAPYSPSGAWSVNGVERQSKEWIAFNSAFALNADAAMESTSIGLGQIMGFHYKRLGFKTVGAMWDDAKKGEFQQVQQMAKFIATDSRLLTALKNKDWHVVACLYNGAGYLALAKKIGREPYNISMQKAYTKYAS